MGYDSIIGANIRKERKKRGLTIEEFAGIIGIAPGFVGLIERGQRGTSITNLVKISDFFGLTLDQLISKREDSDEAEALNAVDKDRKALYSMIGLLSDRKIHILAENAKALNKYIPEKDEKPDKDTKEDQILDS